MQLPDGWKNLKLEEIACLKAGKFIPASQIKSQLDEVCVYPCFGGNGIRGYVSENSHKGLFPIIGRQGALCGNVNLATGRFYATEHAVVATSLNNNDSLWLYYALQFARLNQYATGQAQPGLSVDTINKIVFLVPPLAEQKKIAETLSVWDSAIEKMEKLIGMKDIAYMQILETFFDVPQKTELGSFLKEVSSRNKNVGTSQVLSVSNSRGFVLPEEQFDRKVASNDLSHYKIVKKGQYAYNPSRINVGSIARLDNWESAVISPMYVVFEIKDNAKLNTDLLLHWFNSNEAKQRIKHCAQGSVRETVGFKDLGKIKFPSIDQKKQNDMAEVLNATQKELSLLKQQLALYKKQKQGLMQKLLTGEWRVK